MSSTTRFPAPARNELEVRIIGSGLIARSLQPFADRHDDTVAFATGVSDSSCSDEKEFARECDLLNEALAQARSDQHRFIYFSGGGAIYGQWRRAAAESGPLEPRTPYGRHQLHCETIVRGADVPYLIARLPNVVGPAANPRQLVPSLVNQVLSGRVRVQRNAERDLIAVDDVGRVILPLLDAESHDEIVNVASGHSVPASVIVGEICRILAVQPKLAFEPNGERQRFLTDHLKELLGYDPFPDGDAYRRILRAYVPELAAEFGDSRADTSEPTAS